MSILPTAQRSAAMALVGLVAVLPPRPELPPSAVAALTSAATGDTSGSAAARRELFALGGDATGTVFALLAAGGADGRTLRPSEVALLSAALSSWPDEHVLHELTRCVDSDSSFDDQLLALELIGDRSSAAALDPLVSVWREIEPVHRQHRLAGRALREALAETLTDAKTHRVLGAHLDDADFAFRVAVAQALGDASRVEGLTMLEQLAGDELSIAEAAVASMGRLRSPSAHVAIRTPAEALSDHLNAHDARLRRAAALALGELDATQEFDDLLARLDDEDARVRKAALSSLQRISGLRFPDEPERWRSWHEREQRWFREASADATAAACGSDPATAVAALHELSGHRLFAATLTDELRGAVRCRDSVVVHAACAAIQRLGGPHAVELLIDALANDDVRETAAAALVQRTGQELPPERDAWLAWFETAR